jgi:riboflavin kinase / FMN adenylyltransferase
VEPWLLGISAEDFVDDTLVAALGVRTIVVGPNFRFGRGASGDVALLSELGLTRGFEVRCLELTRHEDAAVSSTRIRAALARGDAGAATVMLGRAPGASTSTRERGARR